MAFILRWAYFGSCTFKASTLIWLLVFTSNQNLHLSFNNVRCQWTAGYSVTRVRRPGSTSRCTTVVRQVRFFLLFPTKVVGRIVIFLPINKQCFGFWDIRTLFVDLEGVRGIFNTFYGRTNIINRGVFRAKGSGGIHPPPHKHKHTHTYTWRLWNHSCVFVFNKHLVMMGPKKCRTKVIMNLTDDFSTISPTSKKTILWRREAWKTIR